MNTIVDFDLLTCASCVKAQVPSTQRFIIGDETGYSCSYCGGSLCAARSDVPRPVTAILTALARQRTFRCASAPVFSSDSKLVSQIAVLDEHSVLHTRETNGEPNFRLGIGKLFSESLRGPVGKMSLVPCQSEGKDDLGASISFSRNLNWCLPAPNGTAGFERRNFPFQIPDAIETSVQVVPSELRRQQIIGFVSKATQGGNRRSLRVEFRTQITLTDLYFGASPHAGLRSAYTKVNSDQVLVVRMEFSWTENTAGEIFIPIWCSDAAAFLSGDLDSVLRYNQSDEYHVNGHLTLEHAHDMALALRGAWGRDCRILKLQHEPYAIALKVTPSDANLHNFIASQFRHNSIKIGGRDKLALFWPDLKPESVSILPSVKGTRKRAQ